MFKKQISLTDYMPKLKFFETEQVDHFKEEYSTGYTGFDKSIIKARFHLL